MEPTTRTRLPCCCCCRRCRQRAYTTTTAAAVQTTAPAATATFMSVSPAAGRRRRTRTIQRYARHVYTHRATHTSLVAALAARLQPQRGMPSTAGTACLRSDAGGALR